jgi:hypothetical protein
MAEIVHRFACATDNDGFPECMGDGSTCGPDDRCLGLEQVKAAPACGCQRLRPIACNGTITAEDLLCDDCRAGCNAAFGNELKGFHMRTVISFG